MVNFISQSHNQITASHMSTDELLLCYHSDDMKSISLPRYKLLSLCPEGEMSDAPPQHERAHLTRAISITYRAPGEGCKTRSLVGFHKSIFPLLASCLYLPCAAEETKSFPADIVPDDSGSRPMSGEQRGYRAMIAQCLKLTSVLDS